MAWTQKEKVIQERRTLEATKKNLMGTSGKLGVIAQTLGNPIIRQGCGLFDVNVLEYEDEFVDVDYESTASGQRGPEIGRDELPEAADMNVEEQGYIFNGLSRGMHLEIHHWLSNQRIEVTYKGYPVYTEISGELLAYAPFPEWEEMIERLYKLAKDRAKGAKAVQEAILNEKIKAEKRNFWTRMRQRWGI